MRFRFVGCGDAWGSGGRFNTCFHVEGDRCSFLIDCGASSMVALRRWGIDPNGIQAVFLSHLHGDHFGGLVFFLLDAQHVSRRQTPLVVAGPAGTGERLAAAREALYPGSTGKPLRFELQVAEIEVGRTDTIGGVAVTPFQADHSSGAPSLALRLEAGGRTIAYSGDTAWTDALIDAGRQADLFVCEGSFRGRKVTGHMDVDDLLAHLPRIAARRVFLTHMGDDVLGQPAPPGVEKAEDGLVLTL